jgi:hypothetical protein
MKNSAIPNSYPFKKELVDEMELIEDAKKLRNQRKRQEALTGIRAKK